MIEMHPYYPQHQQRAFHDEHGIITGSWGPLGRGGQLLKEPVLLEIARAHQVRVGPVVLRWHVQHGAVPIPASANPERRRSNRELGVELTAEAMTAIDGPKQGRIRGAGAGAVRGVLSPVLQRSRARLPRADSLRLSRSTPP